MAAVNITAVGSAVVVLALLVGVIVDLADLVTAVDDRNTGLDEEVREIRDENKERMLHLLIQKIENKKSKPSARFHFEEGMSYEEKEKRDLSDDCSDAVAADTTDSTGKKHRCN